MASCGYSLLASLHRVAQANRSVLCALQTSAARQAGKGGSLLVSQHACFTNSPGKFAVGGQRSTESAGEDIAKSAGEDIAKAEAKDFSEGVTGVPSEEELVQDPWSDTDDRKEAWIAQRSDEGKAPDGAVLATEAAEEAERFGKMGSIDNAHDESILGVGPTLFGNRLTEIRPETMPGGSTLGTRVQPVRKLTTAAFSWASCTVVTGRNGYVRSNHTRTVAGDAVQDSAIAADEDFHHVQNWDPDTAQNALHEGEEDEMMMHNDSAEKEEGHGLEWQWRLDDGSGAKGWESTKGAESVAADANTPLVEETEPSH